MSVDPDPIAERQRTVSRSELEKHSNDEQSMGDQANVDDAIAELLE